MATGALLAFTAWCFLSVSWSEVQDDAWDGANRTLLYFALFTLVAFLPWRTRTMFALIGTFSVAVASIGVIQFSRAATAADPTAYFQFGRFASPILYQNGDCALFLMAFWPALYLFSSRSTSILARGLCAGAATALLELALLTQSRGSLVAVPMTFGIYLLLVPRRLRSVFFATIPAGLLVATYRPLIHVFEASRDQQVSTSSLLDARATLLVSITLAIGLGCGIALADRRVAIPYRAQRVVAIALVLAATAGLFTVATLAARADPIGRANRAWDSFTTPRTAPAQGTNFSTGLSGTRHDLWRVAIQEIRSAPLLGVGVDNFAVDYLRERRTIDEPSYPHSVLLRLVSQTGIIGGILAAVFVAILGIIFVRRSEVRDERARGLHALALVVAGYWLIHGAVDWFWEIPALGGLAFVCFGIAARAGGAALVTTMINKPRSASVVATAIFAAALISLAPPWLAARETARAASTWRDGPELAFERLRRARTLNPLADEPDLIAGAISSRLGDLPQMEAAFRRALERNPRNWYAFLELAVAEALQGDVAAAQSHLASARRLNPREYTIMLVQRNLDEGKKPSPAELDNLFLERIGSISKPKD